MWDSGWWCDCAVIDVIMKMLVRVTEAVACPLSPPICRFFGFM
jgi:hypothetical protein